MPPSSLKCRNAGINAGIIWSDMRKPPRSQKNAARRVRACLSCRLRAPIGPATAEAHRDVSADRHRSSGGARAELPPAIPLPSGINAGARLALRYAFSGGALGLTIHHLRRSTSAHVRGDEMGRSA